MWAMEQPLAIAGIGLVIVAGLVVGLVQTGRRGFLYGACVFGLTTVGMLVLERSVVTPREEVRATLHLIAEDLQRNDVDAVLEHISAGKPKLRMDARAKMALVEILDVDIKRNLRVLLVEQRGMEIAEATFNATFRIRLKRGLSSDSARLYPQFLTVRFRREAAGWRIRAYELEDPRAGMGR